MAVAAAARGRRREAHRHVEPVDEADIVEVLAAGARRGEVISASVTGGDGPRPLQATSPEPQSAVAQVKRPVEESTAQPVRAQNVPDHVPDDGAARWYVPDGAR